MILNFYITAISNIQCIEFNSIVQAIQSALWFFSRFENVHERLERHWQRAGRSSSNICIAAANEAGTVSRTTTTGWRATIFRLLCRLLSKHAGWMECLSPRTRISIAKHPNRLSRNQWNAVHCRSKSAEGWNDCKSWSIQPEHRFGS